MIARQPLAVLTVVVLLLDLSACAAGPKRIQDAHEIWRFEVSVAAVDAVVDGVLERFDISVIEHSFNGATGYVMGRTPSGARVEVSFETILPGKTFVKVFATREYGGQIASSIIEAMYEASGSGG